MKTTIVKGAAREYEVRDGLLEGSGAYDDSVDAVIIKDEHRGSGPVWVRRNGVKTKQPDWMSPSQARKLAKSEGLPLANV